MVRSLWSAASGMMAQQTNVDTIANNLANVNTTGYKAQQNQFKSLLYQNLQSKTTSANGESKPVGAQVGLGVRSAAISAVFEQGEINPTENDTDFAIVGDGLFAVKGEDGQTYYTRNGSFVWAINNNGGVTLTNSDGLPVLSTAGSPIALDKKYMASRIEIDADGAVCYPDEKNNLKPIGPKIGVFQFRNPSGLDREGDSLYSATEASGAAINESTATGIEKSLIRQGYLEASNVQVADEMVRLIVAQRAYELNSKAITTTDTMMGQANQLKQ